MGRAGGKGASLGELTRAGLPVPAGFVVTTVAYRQFLSTNGLEKSIEQELKNLKPGNPESARAVSERISQLMAAAPMAETLAQSLLREYRQLGVPFVAVRSSATAEDSSAASWAGELETFLFTNQATLVENVKRCWISLFSPRALTYRLEKDMVAADVAVAVVVQAMIDSEVSGTCFTVHPVTENPNQLIIEAVWGLGEAMVSGMVTPDSYVVDKMAGMVMETAVSAQKIQIVAKRAGGTAETAVPMSRQTAQKLSSQQILELAKIAVQIEAHYSSPQDIEWAYQGGQFFIVQSRPITTL